MNPFKFIIDLYKGFKKDFIDPSPPPIPPPKFGRHISLKDVAHMGNQLQLIHEILDIDTFFDQLDVSSSKEEIIQALGKWISMKCKAYNVSLLPKE